MRDAPSAPSLNAHGSRGQAERRPRAHTAAPAPGLGRLLRARQPGTGALRRAGRAGSLERGRSYGRCGLLSTRVLLGLRPRTLLLDTVFIGSLPRLGVLVHSITHLQKIRVSIGSRACGILFFDDLLFVFCVFFTFWLV